MDARLRLAGIRMSLGELLEMLWGVALVAVGLVCVTVGWFRIRNPLQPATGLVLFLETRLRLRMPEEAVDSVWNHIGAGRELSYREMVVRFARLMVAAGVPLTI